MVSFTLFIIVVSFTIYLGFLVYKKNPNHFVNILFFLSCFFIGIWSIFTYLENSIGYKLLADLFLKLDFATAIIGIFVVGLFMYSFLNEKFPFTIIKTILIGLPSFILATATFFNLISRESYFERGTLRFIEGPLFIVYQLTMIVYVIWGFTYFYLKFRKIKGVKRLQAKYLMMGLGISLFITVFISLFLQNIVSAQFFRLNVYIFLFFIGFTTYAIVRYRLMDIRIIIKRGTIFALLVALITAIYVFLVTIVGMLTQERFGIFPSVGVGVILSLFIVLGFDFIKTSFSKLTDKIFFKNPINYDEIVKKLIQIMSHEVNLEDLIHSIINTLCESLKLKGASYMILDEKRGCYTPFTGTSSNFLVRKDICLAPQNPLVKYFSLRGKEPLLILEELERHLYEDDLEKRERRVLEKRIIELRKINTFLCMPVRCHNKINCILCVGEKQSGDPFFKRDFEVLRVVADQSGIAIENAKLYGNLERQVEIRTKELDLAVKKLRTTNRQLKKLNQLKSEFLAIASHQLRTPVAIVKGMLSMLASGDLKEKEQKEFIIKSSRAADELSGLIEDLLDVARLDGVDILKNAKKINLNKFVKSIINQFDDLAADKGLRLEYREPRQVLPLFLANTRYLGEAIKNLIDNSIKYTSRGSVIVSLDQKNKKNLILTIKDTGMGFSPDELKRVFDKFYRSKRAITAGIAGTGLGLYAAKKIVEEHGGKVNIRSKGIGKGSIFTVKLPVGEK